jgi:hypothetical protein
MRFSDFVIVLRFSCLGFLAVCCIYDFLTIFPYETLCLLRCNFRMRFSDEI